jgi:1-acyl-sn-glycerol-3-phosphate acyltransferase
MRPPELLPDDGPAGARLLRRVRGLAAEVVGFLVVTALLPVLLVGALVVDLALWAARRKPPTAWRLVLVLWWFLLTETWSAVVLLGIGLVTGAPFVADSTRRRRWTYGLRQRWAAAHLGGIRAIFRLRFEVEGLEAAGDPPVVVLIRHASIIDNLLPDAIIGRGHGTGLRFVLKRELQMLPLIDVGGRWVPTAFIRRASADPAAEAAKLQRLVTGLRPDEGVLIYPEGTRWTAAKLARAQEVIRERQPHVAPMADRLRHLLPPRLTGPLAILGATRGTDVVLCGHVGLDGFELVSDVWGGGLVGQTVRIRFWRHAAAEVPEAEDELVRWLYDRWQVVDDWVGEQRAALGVTVGAPKAQPVAPEVR